MIMRWIAINISGGIMNNIGKFYNFMKGELIMSTKDNKVPEVRIKYFIGKSNYAYDYAVYERTIDMFEVLINGKVGFANKEGKLVIPAMFSPYYDESGKLIPYNGSNEYIFIQKDGRFGAIRKDGNLVLKFEWKDIMHWGGHIVAVAQKKHSYTKWGFINLQTGKTICEPRFTRICVLSEKLVIVGIPAKKLYALFNLETGAFVTEYKYDEYKPFEGPFAPVRVADKWGLIDKSGKEIIKPKYNKEFNFKGDFAIVEKTYWKKTVHSGDSIEWSVEIKKVLINKDGIELVNSHGSKWTSIRRLSNSLFCLKGFAANGRKISSLRQYLKYGDKNIVVKDAHYIYINFVAENGNLDKLYFEEITPESYKKSIKVIEHLNYQNSHIYYIGEGKFAMRDKHGKKIDMTPEELADIKEDLIKKTKRVLDRFGLKLEISND